jgi:hypothetical protein
MVDHVDNGIKCRLGVEGWSPGKTGFSEKIFASAISGPGKRSFAVTWCEGVGKQETKKLKN